MRIEEEYKKAGYFWLPNKPDKKIPGTLIVSDGGSIELEVVGLFDDSIKALNGEDDLKRIIGHIEKDGLVTLEDCFYRTKSISFGGISKSLVHVSKVLSGVAYEQDELVLFNTFSFSIEGLDEWLGISGISIAYTENYRAATISYNPQEEIVFQLDGGFKLHIFFGYTLPIASSFTEAKITQKAYLKLSSEKERELSKFIEVTYKITNLLCFAIDATVSLNNVSATSDTIIREVSEGKTRPVPIKIYYPSLPFSKDIPKIHSHTMLFTFGQIKGDIERILNNWLGAYEVIEPALGLYFSATTGTHKYLDGKFLALVQGLETYHRRTSEEKLMDEKVFRGLVAKMICLCPKDKRAWLKGRLLHGNEINLGKRIKRIIEPFKDLIGNSKERNKLIRNIVDTRNYLTHYSNNLQSKAVEAKDFWVLCQKMEAIFQLHFLKELGFTHEEIYMILKNNYKLEQKFNEI